MKIVKKINTRCNRKLVDIHWHIVSRIPILFLILIIIITSCETDRYGEVWEEDTITICEYLNTNQEEYSKFYSLLEKGDLLITLCGYNPHGEDYTLFLPTNNAVDKFIEQSDKYNNFEELLADTSFIRRITRYHTLDKKLHTDEFPDGGLRDTTLTGERLSTSFNTTGDTATIKVNGNAQIVKSNLDLINGYVHVISGVLQPAEISGYEWIQQQDGYSILAGAMELSQVQDKLWYGVYTILAEHDSVYHRHGIMNIEDLISRIATPGIPYYNRNNSLYKFAGYHILGGEYYLNDFDWGDKNYWTYGYLQLMIQVGRDIRINPGIQTFGTDFTESGDTTVIDYVSPIWKHSNIMTRTGPVHSVTDLLLVKPLSED